MKALAIALALLAAAIGAIQTAGPASLGLPPLAANWLGVVAVLTATAQAFLPEVHKKATRKPRLA